MASQGTIQEVSYPTADGHVSNEHATIKNNKDHKDHSNGSGLGVDSSNQCCTLNVTMPKLIIISFFNALSISVLTIPFMESIKLKFGDHSFVSLLVISSLRNLLHLCGSFVFGQLSDKIGRRSIFLMSIGQQVILAVMFGANYHYAFFILYVILGFFSVIDTILLSYVIDVSDEKTLKRNTALIFAIVPLALLLGILFGYAIKTAKECEVRFWRTAIINGLLVTVTFLVALFTVGDVKEVKYKRNANKSEAIPAASAMGQLRQDLSEMLKPEVIKGLIIILFISLGCEGFFHSVLMYSRSVMKFNIKEETILLALMPICTSLLTMTIPVRLPDLIGTRGTLALSITLLFLAINVMGIFPYKILFFIMVLPISLHHPIRITAFTYGSQHVSHEHAGIFAGCYNLVVHFGVIFSSLTTALLFYFQGIDHASSVRNNECQHLKLTTIMNPFKGHHTKYSIADYFRGGAFMILTVFLLAALFLVYRLRNGNNTIGAKLSKKAMVKNDRDVEEWKESLIA